MKFGKRVPGFCPDLDVGGGEALVKQARVKASAYPRFVHQLPDENELLRAIAEAGMPALLLVWSLILWMIPVFARVPPPTTSQEVPHC